MEDIPAYQDLVIECLNDLKQSFSDEGGNNNYDTYQKARFHSALRWLVTDPQKVLKVAGYEANAAQTMMKACSVFMASKALMSSEARHVIAELMLHYDDFIKNSNSNARFRQHPINIQIIFIIFGLKRKYEIRPTRNDGTRTKLSGCDIVAKACLLYGLKRPRSYQAVKRIWTNRKKYFLNDENSEFTDEQMFEMLIEDIPTYIEHLALADSKI